MGRDTQSFKAHVNRPPFWKKPGSLAAIALFAALAGFAGFCFKAEEKVVLDRVQAKDGVAPYAAYLLGLRGVKNDSTRDALETLLEYRTGDKATPEDLRCAVAYALGSIRQVQVVPYLAEGLAKDPSGNVKAACAKALGRTGQSSAVDPLCYALDDLDPLVRMKAADACGVLKDERPVDKLIDRVMDSNYDVRRASHRALVAITGQDFDVDGAAWKRWREGQNR